MAPGAVHLDVRTSDATDLVDVTDQVEAAVPADVGIGVATVFVPHTTAGVLVNEAERRLLGDLEAALERIVTAEGDYGHDEIDDNAAAHLRAALVGESVTIPVQDGHLALGTWQSVLFVELDGPRSRGLQVVTVGA